jgi:hypothetical protein
MSVQTASAIATLITACLYLLLIGRLVNLQLLSGRGGGVSLAACRRTIAKLLLHDLDVGYRRCTNRANCVKLSAVTGMTYREITRKWSRPVRPISPEGPGEHRKIFVTLQQGSCRNLIPVTVQSKA